MEGGAGGVWVQLGLHSLERLLWAADKDKCPSIGSRVHPLAIKVIIESSIGLCVCVCLRRT